MIEAKGRLGRDPSPPLSEAFGDGGEGGKGVEAARGDGGEQGVVGLHLLYGEGGEED